MRRTGVKCEGGGVGFCEGFGSNDCGLVKKAEKRTQTRHRSARQDTRIQAASFLNYSPRTMEAEKKKAEATLAKFSASLDELEGGVRPVLAAIDRLRSTANDDELDAMSRARLHITLCYATNVLFCMYLRTQGIDPLVHPVVDDVTRVQEAFMRMRKVEAGLSADHQPMPDRDRRRHIQNAKKSAIKLSALVFPEEGDLLRALYKQKKRQRVMVNDSEDENGEADDVVEPDDDDDDLAHVRTTEEDLAELEDIVKKKKHKESKKKEVKEVEKKKKDKKRDKKKRKKSPSK